MNKTIWIGIDYLGAIGTIALEGTRGGTKAKRKKSFKLLERLLQMGGMIPEGGRIMALAEGTDLNGNAVIIMEYSVT